LKWNFSMNIEVGTQIGKCEILEKLGGGSHGTVYKAKHLFLHKTVALKILNIPKEGGKIWEAVLAEVRLAAQLEHPNIVSIYDMGAEEDIYYIIMQFIDGITLGDMIQKQGHLPIDIALIMAQEVAKGLQIAHLKGILHRNFKPSNVLISTNQEIKVSDFGTAKAVENSPIYGSPLYVSPEEAMGKPDIDCRADLYALGAVLYHALTGQPPYRDQDIVALLQQHISGSIPSPKALMPDIPDELDQTIARLLAKKPGDRFNSALELLETLDVIKSDLTIRKRSKANQLAKLGGIASTNRRIRKDHTSGSDPFARRLPPMPKELSRRTLGSDEEKRDPNLEPAEIGLETASFHPDASVRKMMLSKVTEIKPIASSPGQSDL